MTDDNADALARVDLHAWQVPPPAPLDRASLLTRGLTPATAPVRRPRLLIASLVLNAAAAILVVFLFTRPSPSPYIVTLPAGGGSVDARVQELLARLERERTELERRLAEIEELRALVQELSERVRKYEQKDHTVAKPDDRRPPERGQPADDRAAPPAPVPAGQPTSVSSDCDEVSCILTNHQGPCCAALRGAKPPPPPAKKVPEGLTRDMIERGIEKASPAVAGCAKRSVFPGKVKVAVKVQPDGSVSKVTVVETHDAELGACIAAAIKRVTFDETQRGGSFSYPFVF